MNGNKSMSIIIIHLFSAILPLFLLAMPYSGLTGSRLVMIILSFALAFAGLGVQLTVSRKITKGYRLLMQAFQKAKDGDLNTELHENINPQINSIMNESNALIKDFNQVLSNVSHSTEEVKHLVNTVKTTSKEASDIANRIAASAELVSKGAFEQVDDAEESTKITMELVSRFEEVANSAELMTKRADITKDMAEYGKTNISELLEKSKLTESNMEDINRRIYELNNMADNISHITATISGIAGQTTLLSLNASIEAARAGEMGKGFGVVAEEIKKLAQQSVLSSEEINKIIVGIQNQVTVTTDTITSTAKTLAAQIESVQKTNEAFIGISNAVDELFVQLLEVKKEIGALEKFKLTLSDSISNIASVATQTAASTEEITSLMYSQTNSSEILVQLSESFDLVLDNLENAIKKFNFEKLATSKRSFAIIPCIDIPFFADTRDGALDTAAKLGVDVIWRAPESYDSRVQSAIIDEVIEQGVSGIGVGPIDRPEVVQSINRALNKGLKVVYFDTDIPDTGRNGFIGTDNYKAGIKLGELAAKKLAGRGKVFGLLSSQSTLNLKERLDGFMEAIKKYPGIQIIDITTTEQSNIESRWQAAKKAIQKNPKFDCFVCMDSVGSYIVRKMKEELGLSPICVVFDKTEDSLKPLQDGYTSVLAQRPRLWGELSVRRLNELCNGKTINDREDTGTYEINKSNMSVFMRQGNNGVS